MHMLNGQSGSCICQWRDRNLSDFIKKIFICALKMNENVLRLWKDMREIMWVNIPFKFHLQMYE